jgi:site-specific recombinase XerD
VFQLVHEFLIERAQGEGLAPDSVRAYRYRLDHMARHAPADVCAVTARHIEGWLAVSGRAPSYKRGQLVAAVQFFDWCVRRGHCPSNPAREVRKPRLPRAAPRALHQHQADAEVAACRDNRDRVLVLLGLQEGLRRGDIARVRLEDIDLYGEELAVRGKGGRGEVTHTVTLTAQTQDAICDYLREHPVSSGPIIRGYRTGRPVTREWVTRRVSEILYDAGVKRAPYDGRSSHANRHTAAMDILDACEDITVVQQVLGHANVATTSIYARARSTRVRAAMAGRVYGPGAA